jgi:SAM-dependent methyltransferase
MAQKTQLNQGDLNTIWGEEWRKGNYNARNLFENRTFLEGYPVFRKYIPPDTKKIIDLGAGTGRYGVKFALDFPESTVYLTDLLEESLDVMRALAKEVGVANAEFQAEDITKLSFPDNYFDVVYCGMVLQILPDVDAAMREMRRVLKPGGQLIVSTVNFWNFHSLFKWYIKTFNRPPEYYVSETARTSEEVAELFVRHDIRPLARDGFFPAYGIYRLKKYWKPAALIGRALNRANRLIDPWTGRFLSRNFGFEIFVVGTKE